MGNNSEKHIWTIRGVAKAFQNGECEVDGCEVEIKSNMTSLEIRAKMKEILNELDCPESIFRRRAKKVEGHFIFWGDSSVPYKIYRIMEFYDMYCDKICGSFMSDEESILIAMLFEIRPILRQKPCNNTYVEHRKELKDSKDFYVDKYLRIYEQEFFLKVNVKNGRPGKYVRSNIYQYQASLVKAWREKWLFIMRAARSLRINERILNGYKCDLRTSLPKAEDRKRFYLEGYWFDELEAYLKTDRMSEKEIYDACCNLYYCSGNEAAKNIENEQNKQLTYKNYFDKCVNDVIKILSHPLQETSIDDFLYIQRRAMEELKSISMELKEELEVEKKYEEIIYGLDQVRKMIREKGLTGKRCKRLEKILDESFKEIHLQNMKKIISEICEDIRRIVKEEQDYSIAEKGVIAFCSKEIKKYRVQMVPKKKYEVTYSKCESEYKCEYESEYKRYLSDEMREIGIDNEKKELIEGRQEFFIRTRIKYLDLRKEERLIIDFLPEEEREKYWGIREYYTGRELY